MPNAISVFLFDMNKTCLLYAFTSHESTKGSFCILLYALCCLCMLYHYVLYLYMSKQLASVVDSRLQALVLVFKTCAVVY